VTPSLKNCAGLCCAAGVLGSLKTFLIASNEFSGTNTQELCCAVLRCAALQVSGWSENQGLIASNKFSGTITQELCCAALCCAVLR
jgi:hypothetical protein